MPGDDDANGSPDPFGSFAANPLFKAMMGALSGQGPLNWDIARQIAVLGAVGGPADDADDQPEVGQRYEFNDLSRIAALHVTESLGAVGQQSPEILPVTRATWAERTLVDFRPLFIDLATSLTDRRAADRDEDESSDALQAMLGQLTSMMAPAMIGMSIGAMVGAMAQRAFGQYDLPLARPGSRELLIVPGTMRKFADDWSLASSDVGMWVLIHELVSHAVLTTDAVEVGVSALVRRHVAAFRPDPTAIVDTLGSLDAGDDDALDAIQRALSDPTVLLGAVRSPEQERMIPLLDAHVTGVLALIDAVVDEAASRVLGPGHTIAEAIRRRRLDVGTDTVVLERLLGLNLSGEQLRRGADFARGIGERTDGSPVVVLRRMIEAPANLPTPNEIAAPGLWMARLGLT